MTDAIDNPNEALVNASAFFEAGDLDRAKHLFKALADQSATRGWSLFNLGRIARAEKEPEEARCHLIAALNARPDFFWASFELLAVLLDVKVEKSDLTRCVDSLIIATLPKMMAQEHFRQIESCAHQVFDKVDRSMGAKLLEFVYDNTSGKGLSKLGLVRVVEAGSTDVLRRKIAADLSQSDEQDDILRRVLAQYYNDNPQPDEGLSHDDHVPEAITDKELPMGFGDYLAATKSSIKRHDHGMLSRLRAGSFRFPARQRAFLDLVIEIELDKPVRAAIILVENARLFNDVPLYPAIRIVYQLLELGLKDKAELVLRLLTAFHPDECDVGLATVNFLMRYARYEEAESLYDQNFSTLSDPTHSMLCTKAELLVIRGKMTEAREILQPLLIETNPPRNAVNLLIRIAAELEDWAEVYLLGIQQLSGDAGFQAVLEPLVRAARATGQVRALYNILSAMDISSRPSLLFVQQALFEDLVIEGDESLLFQLDTIELPPARRKRITTRLQEKQPYSPEGRNRIYYCADGSYLEPALTSLASLIVSNLSLARQVGLSLIVGPKMMSAAVAGVAPMQRALGVEIDVVDAATIVPDVNNLRTRYGMMTGGHSLTVAAYYRLFFASYLAAKGIVEKALYIDADTLVRPGLSHVFDGAATVPLLARPEVARPEIDLAAAAHRLTRPYFNSGVLLFDFRHSDTKLCLDRSIQAALDPHVSLFFQDQCALNIGFNGRAEPLNNRYNYFITPNQTYSDSSGDAIILHYLDRPKPWDSLYRREADEWFNWLRIRHNLSSLPAEELPQ